MEGGGNQRSGPFISRGDLICVQQDAPFHCEGTFVRGRLWEIVCLVLEAPSLE